MVLLELADLIPFSYSCGGPCRYSNRVHDFSVNIPRSHKEAYVSSTFSYTVGLLNSLHAKLFLLIYDLNGFTSRVNLQISFFSSSFPSNFILRSGC